MEYSEEIKKLAETLKSSGLVASMKDALERAQNMLGKKEAEKEEKIKEEPVEKTTDAAQTTLGEVKESEEKEVIESPETEELKKEEVFANKPDKKRESNKVDYTKEKKVDLTEVFDVNK